MKSKFFFLLVCGMTVSALASTASHKLNSVKQTSTFQVIDNSKEPDKDPFSCVKSISFYVKEAIFIHIDIVKMNGEFVRKIEAREFKPGRYTCEWDGKDAADNIVKSGVYQFRIKTEKCEFQQTLAFLE